MLGKGRLTAAPSLDKLPVGLVEYQHILPDGTPTNFYQELFWDFKKYPHALLVGGTGSGKTTLLKNMLAQFIYRDKEAEIYLATYKPRCEDFSNIMESPHFGDYSHCQEVFHRFYERFLDRLNGSDKTRHMLLLFIDEWVGFLLSLDKKEQDQVVRPDGADCYAGKVTQCSGHPRNAETGRCVFPQWSQRQLQLNNRHGEHVRRWKKNGLSFRLY